jgi:hypothetical protein
MPRDLPGTDILQPLQTKAQSAANIAATVILGAISSAAAAVPSAISEVESAAKAAATAIPDAIKKSISRNFSLGTKRFCMRFSDRTECKDLLLKISNVIPEAVAEIIGDQVEELHLEQISAKITSTNIQNCLILGLVLMAIMAIIFACSIFSGLSRLFCFGGVVSGFLCFVFFLVPVVILHIVLAKANDLLPSSIGIRKGEVIGYCLGTVCCAVVMVLTAILPAFV